MPSHVPSDPDISIYKNDCQFAVGYSDICAQHQALQRNLSAYEDDWRGLETSTQILLFSLVLNNTPQRNTSDFYLISILNYSRRGSNILSNVACRFFFNFFRLPGDRLNPETPRGGEGGDECGLTYKLVGDNYLYYWRL